MAINFKHPDYKDYIDTWCMIDDVCDGDDVDRFLIELNPHDQSIENVDRNKAYKERAVFYPITGKTANGLLSLMFNEAPKIQLPAGLEYLADDVDGSGTSISQQAQCVAEDVIKVARGGLFTTYPEVDHELSRAEMASGQYRATIHEIDAERIINWRTEKVGAKVKLSLVVFSESVPVIGEDGYSFEMVDRLRELAIEGGVFIDRKWQYNKDKDEWFVVSEAMPRDGTGLPWDKIPFVFVGAQNNTPDVDESSLKGMATINIAHYRNSADYEDSCWYVGQAQPWMSGVTQSHIDLMKRENMYAGSRSVMGVPSGETFAYAAAPANSMVREAMMDKLDAMIGIGARFITPGGVAKTAEQSGNENAMATSELSLIAQNISNAYSSSLAFCARYMNVELSEDDGFLISTEFSKVSVDPRSIQAMVAGFVQGAIPASSYFRWLKRADLVDEEKTLEDFTGELDSGGTSMPDLNG